MQHPEFYKQLTVSKEKRSLDPSATNFDRIGPYSIDSLLSKSAKSEIFLAHDQTHKPFVLKILHRDFATTQEYTDQFLQEAKILKMADHANIVKIVDQGIADQRPFIVMEFIQGLSLRQFMTHYTINLHDAFDILLQIFYALSHIHSLGIVHLDLKPENILITENAKIRLIDFGISQFYHEKGSKSFLGTPDYMSPEMRANKGSLDHRSDIYSIFVIAYELFTEKLSFGNIDLSKAPAFLIPFLRKGLALEKGDRFDDIVDCIASLNTIIKTHPISSSFSMSPAIDAISADLMEPLIEHDSLEMGLEHDLQTENLFYTSHALANSGSLFLFYNFQGSSLQSLCQSTILKITTKLLLQNSANSFNFSEFLEALNVVLFQEKGVEGIDFQAIHLDLYSNTIYSSGSGFYTLFNYCNRKNAVAITRSIAKKLGQEERLEASITSFGYNEGDYLMAHNFSAHFPKITQVLKDESCALLERSHLSAPKNLAKNIFSSLKSTCHDHQRTSPLLLFQLTHLE
jgi:serine/threonine protein kinase